MMIDFLQVFGQHELLYTSGLIGMLLWLTFLFGFANLARHIHHESEIGTQKESLASIWKWLRLEVEISAYILLTEAGFLLLKMGGDSHDIGLVLCVVPSLIGVVMVTVASIQHMKLPEPAA